MHPAIRGGAVTDPFTMLRAVKFKTRQLTVVLMSSNDDVALEVAERGQSLFLIVRRGAVS